MTTLQLQHFPYTREGQPIRTDIVYAVVKKEKINEDDWYDTFSGWIDNVFNVDEESIKERPIYKCSILSTKYMEHSNGGRSNLREYDSIEDYYADPKVKEKYQKKLSFAIDDHVDSHDYTGEPDKVDAIYQVSYAGHLFEFSDSLYNEEPIVNEWYSEYFEDVSRKLYDLPTYANYTECVANITSQQDLFGERFFPVVVAHKDKVLELIDCANNFKGCSKPITHKDKVFIGVRAKPSEINYYLEDVFNMNASVVKNAEWDWQ